MGNIERTECVEHGAANMIGRRCHAWVGPYVLCLRDGVTMEYVPASQLAGAVARIRELEDALDKAADALRCEGHYELSAEAYRPLETEWGQWA